jgi:hypothetical protein
MTVTSFLSREDFELACIREFSHSGLHLGDGVSRAERRVRIRVAILSEKKAYQRWRDSSFSYAEAYAQAYHEPLGTSDAQGNEWAGPESLRRRSDVVWVEDEVFEGDDGLAV